MLQQPLPKNKRRNFIRKTAALACAVSLSFTLAGCFEPRVEATLYSQPVSSTAVPIEGGTLNVTIPQAPGPANPLSAKTWEMVSLLDMVYEGLVRTNQEGEITPVLAESWQMQPVEGGQGAVWTFSLRKNVKWHDGTAFTANDVVSTVERIKQDGDLRYQYPVSLITGIEAVDEHTVRISTGDLFYGFLDALTFPIVQADADLEADPCGTGPYRVAVFTPAAGMSLQANQDWWRRPANIARIVARPVSDGESALAAYSMGQVDVVASSLLSAAYYRTRENTSVLEYITGEYIALVPNFSAPLMQDVRMRKAVAHSLDKRALLTSVFGSHALPTDVPVLPDTRFVNATVQGPEYSVPAAKELLAQMGYAVGEDKFLQNSAGMPMQPLTLLVCDTAENHTRLELGNLVAEALKAVGIPTNVVGKGLDDYLTQVSEGNFDLLLSAMSLSRVPDYCFLFASTNPKGQNVGKYSSFEMDTLLANIKKSATEAELDQSVLAMQHKIAQDLPHIALGLRTNSLLYRDNAVMLGELGPQGMDVYRGIENWSLMTVPERE